MTVLKISENSKEKVSSEILEAYSEPCETSKMELFRKIGNGSKPLPSIIKSFILDVSQGSKYTSGFCLREDASL